MAERPGQTAYGQYLVTHSGFLTSEPGSVNGYRVFCVAGIFYIEYFFDFIFVMKELYEKMCLSCGTAGYCEQV